MKELLIEKILEKYLLDENENTKDHNIFIEKYVMIRGYDAGVRCGKLIDGTPGAIILEDARMLYYRRCKKGIGLSGLVSYGLEDRNEVKILETQKKILITDTRVSTFFLVDKKIEKQLREWKVAKQI